jgi:hypothetical protein
MLDIHSEKATLTKVTIDTIIHCIVSINHAQRAIMNKIMTKHAQVFDPRENSRNELRNDQLRLQVLFTMSTLLLRVLPEHHINQAHEGKRFWLGMPTALHYTTLKRILQIPGSACVFFFLEPHIIFP